MNQRRFSFQGEGWFRKHLSKSHQINRVHNWLADKQFDNRKKGFILDSTLKLDRMELIELAKELCQVVRRQRPGIDKKLLKFIITNLKFHFDNKQFIQFISKYLEYRYQAKDSVIVRQGEYYPFLYLLLEGRCEIISQGSTMTVSGEAVFGEKELFGGRQSGSTIRCKSGCEFLVIRGEDFKAEKRRVEVCSSKNMLGILRKIPLFRSFTQTELLELPKHAQIINLEEKGNIVSEGKKHGYFYIIVEGEFMATELVRFREQTVLKFEKFDIINIEGILGKLPLFSVKSVSQNTELYRFSILGLGRLWRECGRGFREGIASKVEFYRNLSQNRGKGGVEKQRVKSKGNVGVFISEVGEEGVWRDTEPQSEEEPQPYPDAFDSVHTEQLRSKVNLFTRAKKLSKSSQSRSGSISSKLSHPIDLSNIHQDLHPDPTKPTHFLLNAYRQKLSTSNPITLDVQNRLYSNPPTFHFFKKRTQQEARTMRMDKTMASFQLSHQHNKSEILPKRAKTGEGSRRKDTEILLKRVQMSSCRKRRNRVKAMFDPQEILDFREGRGDGEEGLYQL